MRIIKRIIKKRKYYYLEHSFREGNKVKKKQRYIGKTIPEEIESIKAKLLSEIYDELWIKKINIIKKNFSYELSHMPPSAKTKQLETFMIKFTYNSQRIEGSTLTLKETANLLERKLSPNEKPIKDVTEAETHKEVFFNMLSYKQDLSLQTIFFWHKKLFSITKPDIAGKIRNHQVAISRSKFSPPFPAELDTLLYEFIKWYNFSKSKIHPAILAALVHLKFVTIHPFSDGNGRSSRMLMNFILNKNQFPMLNIAYEKRAGYYNALEKAQLREEDGIFISWFLKRYIKEYENYLKLF